jgi:stage IV sporulation protein FB
VFSSNPTPLDIKFRLFGFPCRISAMFWLGALLLGNTTLQRPGFPGAGLLIWVACMLVSILVHELGHAFAARTFGSHVTSVVLTVLGGFCSYDGEPRTRWKRIAISLAGPAAGFLLLAVVKGLEVAYGWANYSRYTEYAYGDLWFINLVWGLFNLLPIWPMDGGRVSRELCGAAKFPNPVETSLWISITVAGSLALISLMWYNGTAPGWLTDLLPWWFSPSLITALWMGLFAAENYQLLQQIRYEKRSTFGGPGYGYSDDAPWRRR